jgi:hypothetical protein
MFKVHKIRNSCHTRQSPAAIPHERDADEAQHQVVLSRALQTPWQSRRSRPTAAVSSRRALVLNCNCRGSKETKQAGLRRTTAGLMANEDTIVLGDGMSMWFKLK